MSAEPLIVIPSRGRADNVKPLKGLVMIPELLARTHVIVNYDEHAEYRAALDARYPGVKINLHRTPQSVSSCSEARQCAYNAFKGKPIWYVDDDVRARATSFYCNPNRRGPMQPVVKRLMPINSPKVWQGAYNSVVAALDNGFAFGGMYPDKFGTPTRMWPSCLFQRQFTNFWVDTRLPELQDLDMPGFGPYSEDFYVECEATIRGFVPLCMTGFFVYGETAGADGGYSEYLTAEMSDEANRRIVELYPQAKLVDTPKQKTVHKEVGKVMLNLEKLYLAHNDPMGIVKAYKRQIAVNTAIRYELEVFQPHVEGNPDYAGA